MRTRIVGLLLVIVGCGPQVSANESAEDTDSQDTHPPAADGSSISDSEPEPHTSDTGDTGADDAAEPTQTWCIHSREFPSASTMHRVANLDGGLPELWSIVVESDLHDAGEPATRYVVQRFDGTDLVTIDELTRPGVFYAFGDVDGDGVEDAVVRMSHEDAFWLRGSDSGQLGDDLLPFAPLSQSVELGDRNGDGRLDILRMSPDSSRHLELLVGDGEGGFHLAGSIDTQVDWFEYEMVPLGARHVLLFVREACLGFCGNGARLLLVESANDGSPTEIGRFTIHSDPRFLDFTDRNGDGLPDLLLQHRDTRSENARISWFDSPAYGEVVHVEPSSVSDVADFDLDGANDVIEGGKLDDPRTVRFGQDDGFGAAQPLLQMPRGGFARGDLDGDGWLDTVAPFGADDTLEIWTLLPCDDQ